MTPGRLTSRAAAPVLLVFVLLTVVTSLPYARAFLFPPPGARFVGVFYSIPDVYNYFSYMQQAQDGGFFLADKLSLDARGPALVNLEWWAVGRFAGLTGLCLPLSFRLLGLLASLALVVGMDVWLRRAGLPPGHRLGALLLVFLGGGFGGVLFLVLGPPAWRFLDLTTGLFPFISVLVNPHFVAGTALLVWALLGLTAERFAGRVAGIVLGNVLGLVRPYDLVLLAGARVLTVASTEPPRRWVRAMAPLLGLLPAVLANYWIFFSGRAFQGFKSIDPPVGGLALALGPALALAVLGARYGRVEAGPARSHRAALVAWAAMAILGAGVLSMLFPYLFQSAVNVGAPLLGLAALGLSGGPPRRLLLVAALSASTGLVALKLLLEDNPSWFVPRGRMEVAMALRSSCRAGDLVMAPPDIGMHVNAYSSCRAFVTHGIAPDTAVRLGEMESFYSPAPPALRRELVDRRCVAHVVLASQSDLPSLLGLGTGFVRSAEVGQGEGGLAIFSRTAPAPCASPSPVRLP